MRRICSYFYKRISILISELSISSNNSSRESSPKPIAVISGKYSDNDQVNSDKSIHDNQQSERQIELELVKNNTNDNMFSIFETIDQIDYRMY